MTRLASSRFLCRLAAIAAAGAAALAAAPAAHAAFPGANGLIAATGGFTFGCDGSQVATMRPDGSAFATITPSACDDEDAPSYQFPDWSADGRSMLTFDRANAAVLVATDGAPTPLAMAPYTAYPAKASISPDGTRLAYTRLIQTRRGSRHEVWVRSVDGTSDRRMAAGQMPRFSPDGRRIAYVAPWIARDGRECAPGATTCKGGGTWLMNARTGRKLRRVAPSAGSLDWAPGGDRLVYSSERAFTGANTDLYIARADGKGTRRLTTSRRRAESGAVFSPDGRRIAFVARTHPDEETVRYAIYTMRASGGDVQRIYGGGTERIEDGGSLSISWQPVPR